MLCLHFALRQYRALRDSKNPLLFYNKNVPMSQWARGVGPPLASTTPTHIVRKRLGQLGLTTEALSKYASNSLRKGGATRANSGINLLAVKRHGGWRSDAVEKYITTSMSEHWKIVHSILREDASDEDDE